jgi:phosphatidylinositol kinase/protein kinase (PI-3  family)
LIYFPISSVIDDSSSISESTRTPEFSAPAEATKLAVNQQHLKQAWDVSQISTKEDWFEWMHRLSVEFMKESPSHALRACMSLVDIHPPLAKELFDAAFISCWGDLYDQYQVRTSSYRAKCSLLLNFPQTGRSCSIHRGRNNVAYRPI